MSKNGKFGNIAHSIVWIFLIREQNPYAFGTRVILYEYQSLCEINFENIL